MDSKDKSTIRTLVGIAHAQMSAAQALVSISPHVIVCDDYNTSKLESADQILGEYFYPGQDWRALAKERRAQWEVEELERGRKAREKAEAKRERRRARNLRIAGSAK